MIDRDAQIVALYDRGDTMEAIGRRFGISKERVRQILVAQGHSRRHRSRPSSVYRLYSADFDLLYVGIAGNVAKRLVAHSQTEWWGDVSLIRLEHFATRAEALDVEAKAIRGERPVYNVQVRGSSRPLVRRDSTGLLKR